jgi:hypothetical protein
VQLAASQEGLSSMKLVTYSVNKLFGLVIDIQAKNRKK